MKKIFFTLFFSAGILTLPAQVRCSINKAYAWFTVTLPGTQRVDESGNPVQPVPFVERFIYLEGNGINKPDVRAVYYNNISVPVTITKVEGSTVSVGKKVEDEKEIIIRKKKGNTFWKLDLQAPNEKPWAASACKDIIIRLISAKKICTYTVAGESQLYTPPTY